MRLMVITGAFPQVSQTFIFQKLLRLAQRGIEVEVMARNPGDTAAYASELAALPPTLTLRYLPPTQPQAIAAARLPVMVARSLAVHPKQARRWVAYLRKRYGTSPELGKRLYRLLPFLGSSPDVVHFEFSSLVEEYGDLAVLLPGKKVISCRGADIDILPRMRPALAGAIRRAFDEMDAVHCVTEAMVRSAMAYGLDPGKAFVNYPSVNWEYFQPAPRREPGEALSILTVSRLHWKKGITDAVRALRHVHEAGVRAHYLVVGEGEQREAIQFEIWDQGLSDHVTLAGAQKRETVRAALTEADVFLLPTLSEGLSNAALEAMAMEIPVITTDAGGMPEAVRDGVDGFVVRRRDIDALADRLVRLARDPELRLRMGKSARQRVRDRFGIETQIDVFEQVYRSLAAGRGLPEGTVSCRLT